MRTAEVERIKLTANFLNAVASGTVVAAVVVPFAGIALGTVHPAADPLNVIALSLFLFVSAIVIHSVALRLLSRLEG
jgi:amino acid transporter